MTRATVQPTVPDDADVHLRLVGGAEADLLDRLAPDLFDAPIDPGLLAEFVADPRHHLIVALRDDEVVGFASAVHYVHPDKPAELWVNEVGVTPAHRRRGIGRRLVAALFDHGRTLGCREAWLGTEHDNVAARRLYASAGGREASMVYVTFPLDARGVTP